MTTARKLAFAALVLALPTMLLILAVVLFGGQATQPANPFTDYGAWMPGNTVPDTDCDRLEWDSPHQMSYTYCTLEGDATFTAIRILGSGERIQMVYFFPRQMTLGDLVTWYGQPDRVSLGRAGWYASWPTLQAATQPAVNRYMAPVSVAWFREGFKKR